VKITVTFFKHFLFVLFLCTGAVSYASITIDSVHSTISTCANNGTITIFSHSGSSMLYAIISGPNTRAQQSSNLFVNLPSGSYQIQITDLNSDTARQPVTVSGNYTSPNFAPTFQNPKCPRTATGTIAGNPQNAGTPPFSWVLTNLSTNITTTQASDSFFNLTAGGYRLRQYDSCGNFATYSLTLTAPNDSFNIPSITNRIFGCDSVSMDIQLFLVSGSLTGPYIIKIQTHNGTYQHTANVTAGGSYPHIYESVGGVSYGDSINVTITDACGRSVYRANTIANFNIGVSFASIADSCHTKYMADFYVTGDSTQRNVHPTYMPEPITVLVSNPVTNAVIDSVVTNDLVNHFSQFGYTHALIAGQTYKVKVTDGCGHSYTHIYQWPSTPTPITSHSIINLSCLDSTATVQILWQNTFYTLPTLQLLSGPAHIGSTKPHHVYHDTIIYPQTHMASAGADDYFIQLTNLAAGTYHYRVYDSCGNSLTDSFTVTTANLSNDHFTAAYIKGCPGQNTITVSIDNFCSATLTGANGTVNLNYLFDTIGSLNSGTYILSLQYLHTSSSIPVNQTTACPLIQDTINIVPYQSPQMASSSEIKCHGSVYVVLQPDSTTGVAPYKYEILTGPQTRGIQSSNIFTLSLPGSYQARLSDSCGFTGTFTFTVDTVSFSPVVKSGSPCLGNSVTLSATASPYATYSWQRPSGSFYTGNSLNINPVILADYGTYHISKMVSINGCKDTFHTTYTLMGTGTSQSAASICRGQSYSFGGIQRTQAGVYYDTIPASPCDSILTLTLTIRGPVYDSVSQSICTGQSVTVGPHTYTTTGIYRDTFATTGCDSIHILNLQVSGYRHSSISRAICQGQSTQFNGMTLTQTGVYSDTIATAGCDSIVTLNLTVRSPGYDSVSQSICTGQSVTVGTHIYTTTGIYRDTFTTATCDSIHVLNLSVGGYKQGTASANICPGQSVTFGGMQLSQAGTYYDTIPTATCDSIVTLTLTTGTNAYDSVTQRICTGQSVMVGTHTYTTQGIYRDTFATAGCDSIYVLNLQVGGYKFGFISQNICQGRSTTFGGMTLTQAGTYSDTITTTGCDSITTLTLTITGPAYDSASRSICPGQSVTIGTHTYTSSGIYRDTFATANCDSVYVLNLQVSGYKHGAISQNVCPGQTVLFGGRLVSQPGIYTDTLSTTGCDSITTLTLNIRGPVYDSVSQTICDGQGITVGIHRYTVAGVYRDTFMTSGCDSIHILNLQVSGPNTSPVSENICNGDSVRAGRHIYHTAGIYTDTLVNVRGCDSIQVLTLTVSNPVSPSVSITVSHGPVVAGMQTDTFTASYADCPNPYFSWFQNIAPLGIHTAVAIVSFPVGTDDSVLCRIDCRNQCPAVVYTYSNSIFTGISDQVSFIQGVNIYPNPTQGSFNMDINTVSISNRQAQISVTDMVGQSVLNKSIILQSGFNKEVISLSDAVSGIYIVQLTVDGQYLYYRLVLNKQN
jgi:hypothetical protein